MMCRNTVPVAFYCIETMKGTGIMSEKLKLYGFNNLTKSLSFNIFDICYAETQKEQKEYIEYLDKYVYSHRLIKYFKIVCICDRCTDIEYFPAGL